MYSIQFKLQMELDIFHMNLDTVKKLYPGTARAYAGLNYFIKKCFNGWTFDKCREEFYVKPLVERLQNEGVLIPGIGDQQVKVEDFSELVNMIRRTEIELGVGHTDLGLIEVLLLNGIKGTSVTKALGLWQDGDTQAVRLRARNLMRIYYWHRWNLEFENDVINFLNSHYLGDD